MTAFIRSRLRSVPSRAFTMVELAIVVVVLAILAAVAIVVFLGQRKGAQDAQAKSHVRNVASVARAAAANNDGLYPDLATIRPDEPSVTITDDPSTNPFEVSGVIETGQSATFAALSESGTCWVMISPLNAQDSWESFKVDDGSQCGGIFLAGELVLSAVRAQPDGTLEVGWEEDPEATEYEVCVDDEPCFTTTNTSWSGPGDSVTVRSIRPNGYGPGLTYTRPGSGGGGSSGGGTTTPPLAVDEPGEGSPVSVVVEGSTVILTFTDTGTGADSYELRRCTTVGCTNGTAIAILASNGVGEYEHQDDVAGLIANGAEVARYQVIAVKGVYGTASNWAEVELVVAVAAEPIPMGSPFMGTYGDGRNPNQGFWATIAGRYTASTHGDAFSTACQLSEVPGECVTSNPWFQRGDGTDGYYFVVDKATSGPATQIRLVDPSFQRRQPNSSSNCQLNKATGDCDKLVGGPAPAGASTNGPATTFTLYAPDDTPLDPHDNSSVVCTQTYPALPPTTSSAITDSVLCSINQAGLYVLRVAATGGHGHNQFGINTSGAPARVYGINDISVFARSDNTTLYLAEVRPEHAGKKLVLDFFDAGDASVGDGTMEVLPASRPDGAANPGIVCNWVSEDSSGSQTASGASCALDTTVGGVAQFDGQWVRMTIDLPSTYDCDPSASNPANGCWWRVNLDLNTPYDTATWAAKVVGN